MSTLGQIAALRQTADFLAEQDEQFGSSDFKMAVSNIRDAMEHMRELENRIGKLEEQQKIFRGFEGLVREMIAEVPSQLKIYTREGKAFDPREVPTATNSRIGIEHMGQVMMIGPWLTRLRETLSWNVVRARDVVEAFDKRNGKT
jgi:hypothetical protein